MRTLEDAGTKHRSDVDGASRRPAGRKGGCSVVGGLATAVECPSPLVSSLIQQLLNIRKQLNNKPPPQAGAS